MQKSCQRQSNWNDGMGLHFTGLISLMDSSNKNAWKSASSFYLIYLFMKFTSCASKIGFSCSSNKLVTNMLPIPLKYAFKSRKTLNDVLYERMKYSKNCKAL